MFVDPDVRMRRALRRDAAEIMALQMQRDRARRAGEGDGTVAFTLAIGAALLGLAALRKSTTKSKK